MKTLLLAALAATNVSAWDTWANGPTFEISYENPGKLKMKFVVKVPQNQYVCIAFNDPAAADTDMIQFKGAGISGSAIDLFGKNTEKPTTDGSQSLSDTIGSESNKLYTITTYRSLDTGETTQDSKVECGKTYTWYWFGSPTTAELGTAPLNGKVKVTLGAAPLCAMTLETTEVAASAKTGAHSIASWGIVSLASTTAAYYLA